MTAKMIIQTTLWLTFLGALHCHPNPQHKLDLNISPEEVNSLEQEEPVGRSIDPQTIRNNKIQDTVKIVEQIIKTNPDLPRLTRGEILDLLENITATDRQKANLLGNDRKSKSVMVVMPYTPTNDNNIEDLYTKAPVTQIIGAEPFKTKEEANIEKHSRRRPPVQYNEADNDLAQQNDEEVKKYSASISVKPTKPSQIRRKRPEVTTHVEVTTYRPTTYRPSTRRPVRRRTTTTTSPPSTPTTQHSNHRYNPELTANQGIRIVESPKLNPLQHHKDASTDLDIQENTKQEVFISHDVPVFSSYPVYKKPTSKPKIPKPIEAVRYTTPSAASLVSKPKPETLIEDINFPENLKTVVKDLNLKEATSPKSEQLRLKLEQQNRIKSLLASIGVFVPSTTTSTTTTTPRPVPNAENIADSLSPDMRDLLMSFGLLSNPNEKIPQGHNDKYYPEKAEVTPESYIGFKPLPDDDRSRDDMDALLASFGLGRSARREKSIKIDRKIDEEEKTNFDFIPSDLRDVISDLGIQESRESKKLNISVEQTVEKQHVFNPDTQYATDEELKKLEKLINMVKQLEKMNGTATDEDLKKIDMDSLKELVTSFNNQNETFATLEDQENLETFPDPTAFDAGIAKNEVKRQESTTTTEAPTTLETVTESETANLKDLEASFGGQTEAVTDPPIPETTPKRTGFYYLIDWNTFLDIDDTKGKRVNLRFQPTIGDPKRFLSVSVP